jgi:hypothetical protein
MIARFYALLPYFLTIPEGERFTIYSYTDNGYEVRVYPPLKTDNPAQPDNVEDIQINGLPAFRANTLRIDFVKDSFDRRQGIECDPPYEFIRRTVNSLLSRLRFVTRGFQVKPLDFLQASHQIRYLNDDETELPSEEGLVRGHGAIGFHLSWTAVNAQIWDEIHQLSPYYIPPVWDDLLLDATHVLPEVGPSIVLAATALEVFISYILDELAKRSSVPQELWIWLTNRDGNWLKQPAGRCTPLSRPFWWQNKFGVRTSLWPVLF